MRSYEVLTDGLDSTLPRFFSLPPLSLGGEVGGRGGSYSVSGREETRVQEQKHQDNQTLHS